MCFLLQNVDNILYFPSLEIEMLENHPLLHFQLLQVGVGVIMMDLYVEAVGSGT